MSSPIPPDCGATLGYLPQEFGAYPRTSPQVMLNHIAVLKGISFSLRS